MLWDQIHLEDLVPHFFLLEGAQQYLQRIHELPHQLLFHRCWVISYLIFSQKELYEILGQIHLEDLEPYFFLLEVVRQYLLRIHELPHQLLFLRCWVISYLIFSQKELYEILDQIHLEDLGPYFFLLEVVRQYLRRIHELPRQLLFLRCWVISYLIFSQKELYEILDRIHLEDLGPYFFLLEVVRQYLLRIHELPRQLLFLQCWVISCLIFSQKELYEILDRIHLEDLGPYFFLLEVVRQC